MRLYLFLVLILTQSALKAQFSDDFSDGDFTANPTWSGTNAVYTINGSQQLQLNNTVAATSYLSTTHNLSDLNDREWHLWTRQSFAPSGSNFGRIYLTSSSADLTTNPDGFYLLLGEAGSNDAIRLFKCSGGTHTELLAGPLGQIAASFAVGIRVVRNASGDWSLGIDASGGTNYISAGSVNDPQNLLGTHFGVYNVYTLSNASGFYYDDIFNRVGKLVIKRRKVKLCNDGCSALDVALIAGGLHTLIGLKSVQLSSHPVCFNTGKAGVFKAQSALQRISDIAPFGQRMVVQRYLAELSERVDNIDS